MKAFTSTVIAATLQKSEKISCFQLQSGNKWGIFC